MESQSTIPQKDINTLPKIEFSSNWNNKLNAKAFSTIRLTNNAKYHIGNFYCINLRKEPQFIAQLVSISNFILDKITPAMSYLDTGYSPDVQIKLMRTMYKNKNISFDIQS